MQKEFKFNYDIENMKKDFEIENMQVTAEDIDMLRRYNNNEMCLTSCLDVT